jgi:hypothetical protein
MGMQGAGRPLGSPVDGGEGGYPPSYPQAYSAVLLKKDEIPLALSHIIPYIPTVAQIQPWVIQSKGSNGGRMRDSRGGGSLGPERLSPLPEGPVAGQGGE